MSLKDRDAARDAVIRELVSEHEAEESTLEEVLDWAYRKGHKAGHDAGHARGSADRQAEIVGWIDETAQEAFRLMRDDQARALVFLRDAIRTGAIESGRRQGDGEGGE